MTTQLQPEEKKYKKGMLPYLLIVAGLSLLLLAFLGGRWTAVPQPATVPTATLSPTPIPAALAPTQVPTLVPTAIPPLPTVASTQPCPGTAEVKALTNVDVQRIATEACAFVWRGAPGITTMARCPVGYVCTWDVKKTVEVQLGANQSAEIQAGTWRFIGAYPATDAVHDVCALYRKEVAFGRSENPPFQVEFRSVAPVGPQSCP